jgi:outer membrane protein TolC
MKTVKNNRYFNRYLIFSISIYINVFPCTSVYSQSDSLLSYLQIAAENNPTVLQRCYEYEAAVQKLPQVASLPDPEINIGVFLSPMELVAGNQVADVRLMQMFPWFGTLKAAKDEMSLMAQAKFESFRDAKLQVFYDVQRTWYELHKVKQNILISEKSIEILRTIENLAIVRFRAGPSGNGSTSTNIGISAPSNQNIPSGSSVMQTMGGAVGNTAGSVSNQATTPMPGNSMGSSSGTSGLTDVYQIQIEIGDLQNNIELLKNQWNTVVAQFNSYLNRPPASPVSLPDTLVADSLSPSFLGLSDSLLSGNPMLDMIQYEQQSLEARKQMVTRMGYPMLGIGVDYSFISKSAMSTSSMNGKDMIMPMVTATLPIYRKKYKAMQTEAGLLEDANKEYYKSTANSLQTDYYQAIQLYQDAQRRIKLYAQQYELATKTLNILLKSYATTDADLTDILRVRQQTLDYEYKQIEAVADFNISISWLKRLGNYEIQ